MEFWNSTIVRHIAPAGVILTACPFAPFRNMEPKQSLRALLLSFACITTYAHAYPTKPIRLVMSGPPGSGPEAIARHLAAKLADALGQQVVVDPRPGATGLIGAEIVYKSAPDGHTLWFITSTQLLGTMLYQRFPLTRDFAPIGMLSSTAFGIVVNNNLPVTSIAELIAHAKARPRQLTYGSNGQGATTHLCVELMNTMAGVSMTHVPYKGGTQAMMDLIGGQIQVSCQPLPSIAHLAKGGRARNLAVTTGKRTRIAPDVPAVAETLPGYEVLGWHALMAPLNTPKSIIGKVNATATKIMHTADMQEKLLALGTEATPSTPAEFAARLQSESAKWAKLMKEANIRVE
jgi:tripartite-type tricarboxylate transporter receptor subunit TctC